MSYSTTDELEQIEIAAGLPSGGTAMPPAQGGRRRGSSMFAGPGAVMNYQQTMASLDDSRSSDSGSNLLVDFPPERNPASRGKVDVAAATAGTPSSSSGMAPPPEGGPGKKRQSIVMQPMTGLGAFLDPDDSDFDDSDEEENGPLPGAPMPGASDAVGGPNHRPLVGGFAAAAYEAARAHYYANQAKGGSRPPKAS
uniref:Uncharacterized protein n=1 Tax=Cyclophora tenuis TaxID=216820 RepID=A0A7S1CXH6_CYCTE|mmetsp:Transcript_13597/g.23143  ORF Transcript_13597/g.23143 Transcript_13597/m.23143 type:complete len:196 (+) Transcript_13597:184-771(+)|eukprot:CAMPEP_0116559250 /NCGR_PEP_ID=MMETSP0397-20121206/10286_1 /TAXON_ID=216820 /ORGANISM="Cyclophora tenuis, Strain ECT3854" /LENGTH=195 /DNA_ID=CAMNT_0004084987 /DNA_START=132 /DNA_END=719 /DNA_ORIENTATION=+